MEKVLQNAIRVISEDKIYASTNQHDFVSFTASNGAEGFIDGGNDYLRLGGCAFEPNDDIEQLFIADNTNMKTRIERAIWGTYGEGGKSPFKWIKLKDATCKHLKAILATQPHIRDKWNGHVIQRILKSRQRHNMELKNGA